MLGNKMNDAENKTNDGVFSTCLYLGNLPLGVSEVDVCAHFSDSPAKITRVKLMNGFGFGFVEFTDGVDARDVVPFLHGTDFWGNRSTFQFARGSRPKDDHYSVSPPGYVPYKDQTPATSLRYLLNNYYVSPRYTSLSAKEHRGHSRKDSSSTFKGTWGWHSPAGSPPPHSYPPPSYYSRQPDYGSPPAYHYDYTTPSDESQKPDLPPKTTWGVTTEGPRAMIHLMVIKRWLAEWRMPTGYWSKDNPDGILIEKAAIKRELRRGVVPTNLRHRSEQVYQKLKRGLPGYANDYNIPAIADTGAEENIISAAFARSIGLVPTGFGKRFKLGNLKQVHSSGTVDIQWSFANEAMGSFKVLCHVLPNCTYDLMLGRKFLATTQTLSKFRRRLVNCLFPCNNASSMNLVGSNGMTLDGVLENDIQASGIADTGAERNVIDYDYALRQGFVIDDGPEHRGYLQFADNTMQQTLGQVKTTWTFENGARVPLTLEVLRDCCAPVILGEDFLFANNVFDSYETLLVGDEVQMLCNEAALLAPFAFRSYWQKKADDVLYRLRSKDRRLIGQSKEANNNSTKVEKLRAEEERRRNVWNYRHGFQGSKTTAIERELEKQRREQFETTLHQGSHQSRPPRIPSIPTAA